MEWLIGLAVAVTIVRVIVGTSRGPRRRPPADTMPFCALCQDWHPPGNCAGEW